MAGAGCSSAATTAKSRPSVDFRAYDLLLGEYLKVMTEPGQAVDTRFDYERLFTSDPERAALLRARAASMLMVSPATLSPRDRIAWGINTYNFLVIQTVTENLYDQRLTRGEVQGYRPWCAACGPASTR